MTEAALGREFLTWLWFRCEVDGGTFPLEQGGELGVVFGEYVRLLAPGERAEEHTVRRASPHRASEARQALRAGKLVAAARLELGTAEGSYAVTLDADTFGLRAARYPGVEGADETERSEERLARTEELLALLDELFARFLAVRLTPAWEQSELPAMRAWVASS
ncbi:MAG: hypothetical protein KatS3mg102_0610 [Planctomycetota bacterium]|nr:MAG: hypothetical protein KatS3mg102_0610 [Planctomycetota bacterium]